MDQDLEGCRVSALDSDILRALSIKSGGAPNAALCRWDGKGSTF
ncbi:hypothetical protein [Mesorhizobium sp. M1409]